MINNEILSFIKEQLGGGATKTQLKNMLVTQGGWDEQDVEEAFETLSPAPVSSPVVKTAEVFSVKNEPVKTVTSTPRIDKNFSSNFVRGEQSKNMEPTVSSPSFVAKEASAIIPLQTKPITSGTPNIASSVPSIFGKTKNETSSTPPTSLENKPKTIFSPQSFFNKIQAPNPVVSSIPSPAPVTQKISVFPKTVIRATEETSVRGSVSGNVSVLQKESIKNSHRLSFGLMMFFTGLMIGGVLMNAYMRNYISKNTLDVVFEKGMSAIGLGSPTSLPQEIETQKPLLKTGS
jgi:hypothetical protein